MSVRRLLLTAATGLAVLLPAAPAAAAGGPQPVPSLDIQRYLGDWYQIASVPQWFELLCVRNTTANYRLNTNGTVRVSNRCTTPWGGGITAQGNARVVDNVTGAKLQVTFNRFGDTWLYPSNANYIVIGLGEDYDWAVITDSARTSGFVLSRSVTLAPEQRAGVLDSLTANGINPCRLQITRQRGGATQSGQFC